MAATGFRGTCNLSDPGQEKDAAYPSIIRGRDGAWRAVYSADGKSKIKFVRFTRAWLEKCFAGQG